MVQRALEDEIVVEQIYHPEQRDIVAPAKVDKRVGAIVADREVADTGEVERAYIDKIEPLIEIVDGVAV